MILFYLTSEDKKPELKSDLRKDIDRCIHETAQGTESSFEELYKLTSPSVYAYSLSYLKNKYDAEDVMHDCYLQIYKSAGQYRSCRKPMAWILTIARNLALQKIKAQGKTVHFPDKWDHQASPDKEMSLEDREIISLCFKMLTDSEREIIILHAVLHAVANFKHREIAEHMKMPLATVLSKYSRAIKKLKTKMEKEMNAL